MGERKEGAVEEVTGTGEQYTPWTETRNNECAGIRTTALPWLSM